MEFSDEDLSEGVAEGNMDGKVADIKGQIAELEAEQEQYEFGSYAYDTVDGELQYLYAKLDKAEKGVAEARDGDINFGHTVTRGSWVVYDGTKVKRFKTHDGATAYAEKNGGKVASSEFYTDKIQKQGVAEGAPISGDGGAVDNFKQQMANNTELAYQKKQQGMAEGDTVVKHRIGLTVTDPNHPMASKRNEPIQKTVRVPGDDPAKAINAAIAHYRRKGYKVHDHHYMGTVDYTIDEAAPDWLRRTAGAATGALAGVGASFPGAAIAGPIGGAVAGAYGAKAGYDLGADAADWVYDKVTGKRVPADKPEVDEGLGYSQDPDQAKWYHEGRRAFKGGTTGDLIQDIAKKHGCPPEWLKAFHAGYQDQEGWSKEGVAEAKRKKKSSRSSRGYFFPGYAYYGVGDSGEGGGDGGGESKNRGMAETGYRQGFADPNAPSLGGGRRKDDEGNPEFDDRQRRQTGMIFYNVDDAELAQQLGLKQTRSGKWYLRTGNRHAQQTADRTFGLGRIWYPESVEEAGVFGFMSNEPDKPAVKKPNFSLSQIRDMSKQEDEKVAKYVRTNDLPKNPNHMRVVHDDVELGELSNELLGRYKKELGIRASAADRAGDYDRGHEYFKKINRATVRQGDNDARRHAEKDMMETRLNMMRKAGYDL